MLEEKDIQKNTIDGISLLHRIDDKVNRLIEILKSKSMLTKDEDSQFKDFQVFPRV